MGGRVIQAAHTVHQAEDVGLVVPLLLIHGAAGVVGVAGAGEVMAVVDAGERGSKISFERERTLIERGATYGLSRPD